MSWSVSRANDGRFVTGAWFRACLRAAPGFAAAAAAILGLALPAAAWEVESGSRGNAIELELYNLNRNASMDGLEAAITDAPSWVTGLELATAPGTRLPPGEKTVVGVRFDIASGAPAGSGGELTLLVRSSSGDEWRQAIPLQVTGHAPATQTDCCTSLEIVPTGVASDPGPLAGGALLVESFPNPSNPASTIRFGLSADSNVQVAVHDVTGRLVKTLAEGPLAPGIHQVRWDGRDAEGRPVKSGVYFVRVRAGGEARAAKLVVTR